MVAVLDSGELHTPSNSAPGNVTSGFEMAIVGVFTPWKLANATNRGWHFGELNGIPFSSTPLNKTTAQKNILRVCNKCEANFYLEDG